MPEQWMMGVTSLEVKKRVFNITEKNNKLELYYPDKRLISYEAATEFVSKIKNLNEIPVIWKKLKKPIVDNYKRNYTFT